MPRILPDPSSLPIDYAGSTMPDRQCRIDAPGGILPAVDNRLVRETPTASRYSDDVRLPEVSRRASVVSRLRLSVASAVFRVGIGRGGIGLRRFL
jgi:hypothetical protein